MLTNATITRIDRQGIPDAAGRPRFTAGDAIAVRCAVDAIMGRQRYTLGAVLEDATQVVYVERGRIDEAGEALPGNGDQLIIQDDAPGSTPHTVTVIINGDRLAPGAGVLSHLELFVRREALPESWTG
jgi:hypothetical protein